MTKSEIVKRLLVAGFVESYPDTYTKRGNMELLYVTLKPNGGITCNFDLGDMLSNLTFKDITPKTKTFKGGVNGFVKKFSRDLNNNTCPYCNNKLRDNKCAVCDYDYNYRNNKEIHTATFTDINYSDDKSTERKRPVSDVLTDKTIEDILGEKK